MKKNLKDKKSLNFLNLKGFLQKEIIIEKLMKKIFILQRYLKN